MFSNHTPLHVQTPSDDVALQRRIAFMQETIKKMFAVTPEGLATKGTAALDESGGSQVKVIQSLFDNKISDEETVMAMMDRLRGHIITAQGFDETFGSAILFLNTLEQTISFNGNEVLVPEVLKQLGIQVIAKTDAGLASPDALGEQYGKNNLDKLAGAGGILQQIADRNVVGIKQRLVVVINDQAPTNALLKDNAELMAQCAKLCQQTISQDGSVQGMVAMSEPEILRTGTHDINTCFDVWCRQIEFLKESYAAHQVDPSCVVIKTSLITPSDLLLDSISDEAIAQKTYEGLKLKLTDYAGGIVFLSGGLDADRYFSICKHIVDLARADGCQTPIGTSASRAIQGEAREAFSKTNEFYGASFDEERENVHRAAKVAIEKNNAVFSGNRQV